MEEKSRLFGTSGIRGRYGEKINAELGLNVGKALATSLNGKGNVVIGYDTRTTNELLENAIIAGLLECGVNVLKLGMVPTPLTGYACSKLNADAGVMITASHNPPEYNGIKLWNKDGSAYNEEQEREIEDIIYNKSYKTVDWDEVGYIKNIKDIERTYIENLLDLVDIDKKLKVVVDPGSGAASKLSPIVIRKAGCEVLTINSQVDGFFPGRKPEPKAENLKDLITMVKDTNADLGIAHDGDADRMVAIDDEGNMAEFDKLLGLISRHLCTEEGSTMVTTVDASLCIDDCLKDIKGKVIRTKVGDVHVVQSMNENNAYFGGEPSGTWIHPDFCSCPDGILSALRVIEMVSKNGKLSEQLSKVTSYPTERITIKCSEENKKPILKVIEEKISLCFNDIAGLNNIDGVRISFKDGSWVLARPSGTEPYVRITLEGKTQERADEIEKISKKFIEDELKKL